MRYLKLQQLVSMAVNRQDRRPDGIFVAPFETGEIGLDLLRKTCP
jgi:hypothetical protein